MKPTPKHHVISYRDKSYHCERKNGKIYVKVERTARGQDLIAGIYSLVWGLWEEEGCKAPLPKKVKKTVEDLYS